MKQKDHLPFFGIGPFYVGIIAILTVIGISSPLEDTWTAVLSRH